MAGDNMVNVSKQQAVDVRVNAFSLAVTSGRTASGTSLDTDKLLENAKKIEKFLWGGFAPIEKPPTPFTTVDEAVSAARERLNEYVKNSQGIDVSLFQNALASLERFSSDLDKAFASTINAAN